MTTDPNALVERFATRVSRPFERDHTLDSKQLISVAYWIGMASTVLAIIDRGLLMIGVSVFPGMAQPAGKAPLSPKSFLEGAVLFFFMAIASYVKWDKTEKL